MTTRVSEEQRLAVVAPTGRDAELIQRVFAEASTESVACQNIESLCEAIDAGVGAIVLAEEAVSDATSFRSLEKAIERQPPWSDLPILLLTTRGADSPIAITGLEKLGNVTLLERPLRVGSLVSNARAALRARLRQYQIRAHIAERATSEEALRQADRRKDEFLATLAHELRNPLAPIRNAARIVKMTANEASLQNASELIDRQVRHLGRMLEDLLDVSRISRLKTVLRLERVDLATVIRDAIETSAPLMSERQQDFGFDLAREPMPMDADATRLGQVISNLLNNAAKFTPSGGHITLRALRDGRIATIRIRDSGIGIEADQLATIFDMFVQADNRLERETGGLGLGLTIVRHFAELHGGSVRASSAGTGLGSEFVLTLPLVVAESPADPPISLPIEAATEPRPLNILVVDDNRDSANTMCVLLQMFGYQVSAANSGQEALKRVAEAPFDVVLLDIGMPGMNGYEVAKRIRDRAEGEHVLLIAVTGWGQESDRARSRAAGFDHHLVKPVDIDQLIELLPPSS